jgi:hypothetical protein
MGSGPRRTRGKASTASQGGRRRSRPPTRSAGRSRGRHPSSAPARSALPSCIDCRCCCSQVPPGFPGWNRTSERPISRTGGPCQQTTGKRAGEPGLEPGSTGSEPVGTAELPPFPIETIAIQGGHGLRALPPFHLGNEVTETGTPRSFEPPVGVEPTTARLPSGCSATELLRRKGRLPDSNRTGLGSRSPRSSPSPTPALNRVPHAYEACARPHVLAGQATSLSATFGGPYPAGTIGSGQHGAGHSGRAATRCRPGRPCLTRAGPSLDGRRSDRSRSKSSKET